MNAFVIKVSKNKCICLNAQIDFIYSQTTGQQSLLQLASWRRLNISFLHRQVHILELLQHLDGSAVSYFMIIATLNLGTLNFSPHSMYFRVVSFTLVLLVLRKPLRIIEICSQLTQKLDNLQSANFAQLNKAIQCNSAIRRLDK